MRAVIDTNVLLSGLLWRGAPHALIEHVQSGTLAMVSSPTRLAELDEVIGRAKFDEILGRSNTSRERSLAEMRQLAEVIVPPPLPQPVCRDPDDDHVLACALPLRPISSFRAMPTFSTCASIRVFASSPPPRRYASLSSPFRLVDDFGMMREGPHAWINGISTNWSKAYAK